MPVSDCKYVTAWEKACFSSFLMEKEKANFGTFLSRKILSVLVIGAHLCYGVVRSHTALVNAVSNRCFEGRKETLG